MAVDNILDRVRGEVSAYRIRADGEDSLDSALKDDERYDTLLKLTNTMVRFCFFFPITPNLRTLNSEYWQISVVLCTILSLFRSAKSSSTLRLDEPTRTYSFFVWFEEDGKLNFSTLLFTKASFS